MYSMSIDRGWATTSFKTASLSRLASLLLVSLLAPTFVPLPLCICVSQVYSCSITRLCPSLFVWFTTSKNLKCPSLRQASCLHLTGSKLNFPLGSLCYLFIHFPLLTKQASWPSATSMNLLIQKIVVCHLITITIMSDIAHICHA